MIILKLPIGILMIVRVLIALLFLVLCYLCFSHVIYFLRGPEQELRECNCNATIGLVYATISGINIKCMVSLFNL